MQNTKHITNRTSIILVFSFYRTIGVISREVILKITSIGVQMYLSLDTSSKMLWSHTSLFDKLSTCQYLQQWLCAPRDNMYPHEAKVYEKLDLGDDLKQEDINNSHMLCVPGKLYSADLSFKFQGHQKTFWKLKEAEFQNGIAVSASISASPGQSVSQKNNSFRRNQSEWSIRGKH